MTESFQELIERSQVDIPAPPRHSPLRLIGTILGIGACALAVAWLVVIWAALGPLVLALLW